MTALCRIGEEGSDTDKKVLCRDWKGKKMNLKRELRGTCGPVAQLVLINFNSEQQGSDFFHLYIYVRMACFTFRVIPGNMSYVCTLE